MGKAKIAITLDEKIVVRLDRLVKQEAFSNRSQAIEEALRDKLQRLDRTRLARELSNLDPEYEKALAEEGLAKDTSEWPEF
jgi:metal-responsive CopG/Arc/MetJ family transcriptional regulator